MVDEIILYYDARSKKNTKRPVIVREEITDINGELMDCWLAGKTPEACLKKCKYE